MRMKTASDQSYNSQRTPHKRPRLIAIDTKLPINFIIDI